MQNWYDTVPLNDIAKRGLREIEKRFREAAGDWSLVAASQLDEAEVHAGEHFQSWLAGCLGLTPSQATRIRAMSLQALQDREALRMAQEGQTQTQIGEQLDKPRRTVSDAIQRASTVLAATSANAVAPPKPDCRRKLSSEQRAIIVQRIANGDKPQTIADDFHVHVNTIRNLKKREAKKKINEITNTPLPTTPSSGNDVSSNGDLVTPSVALFTEEGHDLQKLTAYHHKRFVQELKHCFAAIDNATRRLDKVHNAVLDDLQKNHRMMYLRWTVYEQLWSKEMQLDLECIDFPEIERRLDSKAKLLAKKVKHAFSDLQYDRSKITIAK